MSVDSERKLQNKVKHWLIDDLGYIFLGNLEDRRNTPVKEELLSTSLKKRGYKPEQITKAVAELRSRVSNQADNLYTVNKAVYALLRYGLQGVKDDAGHRNTVHYIDWTDAGKTISMWRRKLPFYAMTAQPRSAPTSFCMSMALRLVCLS